MCRVCDFPRVKRFQEIKLWANFTHDLWDCQMAFQVLRLDDKKLGHRALKLPDEQGSLRIFSLCKMK